MTRKRQISKRFSEAAGYYHERAAVQREIAKDTANLLPAGGLNGSCLDLGCGTGFLGAKLAAENPGLAVLGIDVAPGMIELARTEFKQLTNLNFQVGDCSEELPSGSCEYLVSSSSLQWMHPFEKTLRLWVSALAPGGVMALSLMVQGTLSELKRAREEATRLTPNETLPSLDEITSIIGASGAKILSSFKKNYTASYSSADELLEDLRCLGVNAPLRDEVEPKLTVDEFNLLKLKLDGTAAARGGLQLTYVVGFIAARR